MLTERSALVGLSWPSGRGSQLGFRLPQAPRRALSRALIRSAALLSAFRDPGLRQHITRVRALTWALGMALEGMPNSHPLTQTFVTDLADASLLHDVGKVMVPRSLRLKPGPLTAPEFETMATHTTRGAQIVSSVAWRPGERNTLAMARDIAHAHHERWDGTGYPEQLSGRQIPLCARIVAVADVYDALRSSRPYKKAMPHPRSREIIRAGAGSQFDPWVVAGFLRAEAQISTLWVSLADTSAGRTRSSCGLVPALEGLGPD